jgi:lysophospholipase L1-like esterase
VGLISTIGSIHRTRLPDVESSGQLGRNMPYPFPDASPQSVGRTGRRDSAGGQRYSGEVERLARRKEIGHHVIVNRGSIRARALIASLVAGATIATFAGGPAADAGMARTSARSAGVSTSPDTTTTTTTPTTTTTTVPAPPPWQTVWTSPMDEQYGSIYNSTVRDVAQVAVGGTSIELQLSNLRSGTPTTFGSVTVGAQQGGAAIVPGSIVPVTFGGASSITVPAYGQVFSDPVAVAVHAGESLSISLSVVGPATVSVHFCCAGRIDSYATVNGGGDQAANPAADAFPLGDANTRWLSAIAVSGTSSQGTVVAFGDSITEGFPGLPTDPVGWPSTLQQRITQLPPSQQLAVVDEGIAGNTLSVFPPGASYADGSGGQPGVTRLGPDALALPGVKDVLLFLGTNDIWFGAGGPNTARPIPPYGTAVAIEAAMGSTIAATHAAGIKIIGVTLLPRSTFGGGNGEDPEVWSPSDQATLIAVNAWILSPDSGFDGTINLNAVMGDVYNGACQPDMPFAPYFNIDNLHPNSAGETVMADAIPTPIFGIQQAPQVAQTIAVTPTPGCPGAIAAEQVLALAKAPAPPPPSTTTTTTTTSPPTTTSPTTQPVRRTVPRPRGASHTTAFVVAAVAAVAVTMAILLVVLRRRARRLAA